MGGRQVHQRVDEEIGCGASGENVLALANARDSGSIAGDTREPGTDREAADYKFDGFDAATGEKG